jgi:hypothetical protein
MQVQEDGQRIADRSPVTGLHHEGTYNIEILQRALAYREVTMERGDQRCPHKVENLLSQPSGNGEADDEDRTL